MDSELDLVAEPVIGWKVLTVRDWRECVAPDVCEVDHTDALWLLSPQQGTEWPHDRPLEAVCTMKQVTAVMRPRRNWLEAGDAEPKSIEFDIVTAAVEGSVPHRIEDSRLTEFVYGPHRCGVYAADQPVHVAAYLATNYDTVLCRVKGWGKIVPGTTGWRAQYACVDALTLTGSVDANVIADVAQLYRVPVLDPQDLPAWTPEGRAAMATFTVQVNLTAAAWNTAVKRVTDALLGSPHVGKMHVFTTADTPTPKPKHPKSKRPKKTIVGVPAAVQRRRDALQLAHEHRRRRERRGAA